MPLRETCKSFGRAILPSFVQRKLRTTLHKGRQARFGKRQTAVRYGEYELNLELVDEKGAQWYGGDHGLDPEIVLLRERRLKPGARVFDLGAHQGVVALVLGKIVGETGQVVAVEANPFDYEAAVNNRALNGCPQLVLRHAAVAEAAGTLEFSVSGRVSSANDVLETVRVDAITIDQMAAEHGVPDVLFIDVDGSEGAALRGACEVLRHRPDCYLEVHPPYLKDFGEDAHSVLTVLRESGYRLLASQVMKTSQRVFVPWEDAEIDMADFFHVVALAD